jgi:hypothetical protein
MKTRALALSYLLLVALSANAQSPVRLPQASPAAAAMETIGVTDVTISYHRPAVNKRKIFGGLVPFGVVWRAGANENTTISFSTPVKVEGQPLAAGTYGLFMIPDAGQWTVVFSKFTRDWGAYSYDASEDVLRVKVTSQPMNDPQERMSFTFDDLATNAATASLRWDKTRVPFRIEVDLPATVRASLRDELRGGAHWNSDAWAAAARFESRNGDLDTAMKYADQALETGATFGALLTKASIQQKKGDTKGAAATRERAKAVANEVEMIGLTSGDDAIAYLTAYEAAHPTSPNLWRVYAALGDAWGAKGDAAKAKAFYDKAMAAAHDVSERTEVQDSINAAGAAVK